MPGTYNTTLDQHGHSVALRRFTRGKNWRNRTLYGWTLACSCGWASRTNEGKREAVGLAKAHLAAAGKGER